MNVYVDSCGGNNLPVVHQREFGFSNYSQLRTTAVHRKVEATQKSPLSVMTTVTVVYSRCDQLFFCDCTAVFKVTPLNSHI